MRLFAAPGLTVRDPRTRQFIPEEGIEVGPHDFDLHRMLADGDLVEVAPPTLAAKVPPAPPAPPAPAAAAADKGSVS